MYTWDRLFVIFVRVVLYTWDRLFVILVRVVLYTWDRLFVILVRVVLYTWDRLFVILVRVVLYTWDRLFVILVRVVLYTWDRLFLILVRVVLYTWDRLKRGTKRAWEYRRTAFRDGPSPPMSENHRGSLDPPQPQGRIFSRTSCDEGRISDGPPARADFLTPKFRTTGS